MKKIPRPTLHGVKSLSEARSDVFSNEDFEKARQALEKANIPIRGNMIWNCDLHRFEFDD